jgi:hypothetical protein
MLEDTKVEQKVEAPLTRKDLIRALQTALTPLEVEGNAAHNAAVRLADVLLAFCQTNVLRQ